MAWEGTRSRQEGIPPEAPVRRGHKDADPRPVRVHVMAQHPDICEEHMNVSRADGQNGQGLFGRLRSKSWGTGRDRPRWMCPDPFVVRDWRTTAAAAVPLIT
jgi:hypothetical protein